MATALLRRDPAAPRSALDFLDIPDSPAGAFLDAPDGAPVQPQEFDPETAYYGDFASLGNNLTADQLARAKQQLMAPLIRLPTMPDLSAMPAPQTPFDNETSLTPAQAAGVYNAIKGPVEELSSPFNLGIMGATMGLGTAAAAGSVGAKAALVGTGVGFGTLAAVDTVKLVQHAREVLADPKTTEQQRTQAQTAPVVSGLMGLAALAGAGRLAAGEAIPRINAAYPQVFWKKSGLTAEQFAADYPAAVRRVAGVGGEKPTAADTALVQQINAAADAAGVKLGDLARGRMVAENITWEPRAVQAILPESLLPTEPTSRLSFRAAGINGKGPARQPVSPVAASASEPTPGTPAAPAPSAMLFLDAPLDSAPGSLVPLRPVAPGVSVAPVPPSAPAQVAPPEPPPAPVDNAPVVAPPAPAAAPVAQGLPDNFDAPDENGWALDRQSGNIYNQKFGVWHETASGLQTDDGGNTFVSPDEMAAKIAARNAPVVAPPAGALVSSDRGLLYDAQVESDSKVKPGQQLRAVPGTPETKAHAMELIQTLQDGDQILTADGMLLNVERSINKLSGRTSILLVTQKGNPIDGRARTPVDNQGKAVPGVTRLDVDNNYRGIIESGKIIRKPEPAPLAAPKTPPAPVTVPPVAPPARLPEPAAPVPGTPADEFGALHGPKLAPDAAQKFRDTEFQQDLGTTDGIDYKIETRGNKLWVTASKVAIKGRGADYVEQGIAYLQVDQAGNTILNGSFTNPGLKDSPLAIGAKAKMIAFINDMAATSLPEPAALAAPKTPPAPVTVPPAAPPSSPGFPAAVVLTGATSRPAPLTVPPAAPEVKPASRRQIAEQRAEIRRLTKLADQAAQSSPERAGQYTAQAQQAREKLGEMESNTITGPTPQVGPDPQGNADLLTQIADYVGKINMTPPANNVGGEYDGLAAAFSRGAARLLRSSGGGANIVNAIAELNESAGTQFTSPSQFFEAVDRAVSNRQNVARDLDRQAYRDKVEAMAQTDTKKGRPRALVPSTANVIDQVGVGGEFKLNKEKFSVVDTDEGPGGIILYIIQDGHRFTIPEGTPIYADKGSIKSAEVAPQKPATAGPQSDDPFGDNFVPEPDVPAAAAPTPSTENEFVARSQELQRILRAAGYSKGDGVSTAGLKLVSELAKKNGLRQWPNTQTIADYDALIAVVRDDLNLAAGIKSPVVAPTPGTQADLVAGIERQAAAPALTLESASVGQQAAEAQAAREAQLVAKRRADMLAANEQPLTGDSSNVNQGQLYAEDADMFSGASAQEMAAPPQPRRSSSAVGDPGPLEPGMPPIPPGVPSGNLNYGRMPVAMERMAPGTVDVPTVLDALRAVARAAGSMTDIREGRFSQKALGIAKSWSEIIRLRQLNNLPTAAHEVGHIVSKAIFGSMKSKPMMRQAFPAPVIKELQAMGKALYGSTKPVAGYTAEGFAELVRLWLSTEDAARRAPLATKWLEETLFPLQSAKGSTPSLGQAMRYARDQFDLWRAQGAEGRIGAQTKDEPGRWQRVKTWAKENLSGRAVGEEFAPLEELAKAYTTTTGNRLAPGENPYMIATALRGTAGARLETWVDRAMTDLNGTVTGPSLREAVAPVRAANAEEFQLYLTVRQAIERLKQGKNPGIEPEDAIYVRDKYEKAHPEFIAAAEGMADWWAGVLNYLEQAWPDKNSKVIAAVRAANPRYFGPLARVLDPARVRPAAADSVGGGIHRFKGSGLPIKKLLLQSLYVAEGMIAQAHRDAIARSVFRLAEVEGMGWIIEEVPITKAMEQVNIEKLRSQLEAMGVDTSAIAPDEMLSYATMRDTPTGIDPIIALDTANGKRWFQVPAMVFEILEGVQEPARLGPLFEIFAGIPARAFKLGTTGVRASFSLVTNPLRDLPTFMLQSIAGNPASRVANYLGALAGVVKAGLGGNQSPAAELAHLLGLQSSTFLGGDIAQARREAKGLFHGKFYRRITSPVEFLREILSFTETAPRLAEMEMIGRELGWKPGQPLTRDQAVVMMVAFKRVTTDFAAKGSKWRALYRSVPFANAAVQGARALGRAFSRDQGTKEKHYAPLRAVLNGLTLLTLPALWNYWANKDEEWFQMLPWRERYLYLNVSAGRNVYQIPLPPEWASAFATLPIAALDSWYHNDRKALVSAFDHVLSVVNPLDYPVLAKVAKEQWSNHIEFFNRPIVPRGELDLLPGAQRGLYTSEIGNELGNIFPNQVSPRRFDAAVRAVFGGVGGDVIDAPGALMRALGLKTQIANREMEPSDIPVFGRLARRGGQFSAASQPLTEFWDDYNRYSAWRASNQKALMGRTPVLEPMSFQEQAYGMKLALLEPYIKLRMEIAARTPELDKRQAIYQATSQRAQKLLESRPTKK